MAHWLNQMGHPIVPLHVHVLVIVTWHQQDQYIGVPKKIQKYVNYNYIFNYWMCPRKGYFFIVISSTWLCEQVGKGSRHFMFVSASQYISFFLTCT
jgi:hypothetical protein